MERVLNTHTGVVHKPGLDPDDGVAACGALRHAPRERIEVVSDADLGSDAVARCGRCFEGVGGY